MAQELPLAAGAPGSILQRPRRAGALARPLAVASAGAGWCVWGRGGGAALFPTLAALGTFLDGSVLQATHGDSPVASPLPLEPVTAGFQILRAGLPAAVRQGTILLLVESGFLPDMRDTKPAMGTERIKIPSLLSPSCIFISPAPPALDLHCDDLQPFRPIQHH